MANPRRFLMAIATIIFVASGFISPQDTAVEKLIEAVLNSDFEAARAAIASGADVNGISAEGMYPLHYAVNSELPRMVRFLIENKAGVNERETNSRFPTSAAVVVHMPRARLGFN